MSAPLDFCEKVCYAMKQEKSRVNPDLGELLGDSYRAELKKTKKAQIVPTPTVANSVSKERARVRAEYFRESRKGYRKSIAAKKAGQERLM